MLFEPGAQFGVLVEQLKCFGDQWVVAVLAVVGTTELENVFRFFVVHGLTVAVGGFGLLTFKDFAELRLAAGQA